MRARVTASRSSSSATRANAASSAAAATEVANACSASSTIARQPSSPSSRASAAACGPDRSRSLSGHLSSAELRSHSYRSMPRISDAFRGGVRPPECLKTRTRSAGTWSASRSARASRCQNQRAIEGVGDAGHTGHATVARRLARTIGKTRRSRRRPGELDVARHVPDTLRSRTRTQDVEQDQQPAGTSSLARGQ